jgi:hypothetical protein
MSLQDQFSKAAEESTNLFLELERIKAKLRSAKRPDERTALVSSV